MANSDVRNLEAVTELPLYESLTWLTYEIDKARLEQIAARQHSR